MSQQKNGWRVLLWWLHLNADAGPHSSLPCVLHRETGNDGTHHATARAPLQTNDPYLHPGHFVYFLTAHASFCALRNARPLLDIFTRKCNGERVSWCFAWKRIWIGNSSGVLHVFLYTKIHTVLPCMPFLVLFFVTTHEYGRERWCIRVCMYILMFC